MASLEELLKPIPGDNPSGENIRYNPNFDKLKEARRDSGDFLSEGSGPDWAQVVKLGEELLIKKSKDIQVAVWLLEAYIHRQGFAGLRMGIQLVKGLIENFWDTLHPELEDGDAGLRLGPLDWMGGSYLDAAIKTVPISKGGHGHVQYVESQLVGVLPPEDEYGDAADQQRAAHAAAVEDGKITGEEFNAGFARTPKQYYVDLMADIEGILELLDELQVLCEQKFTDEPPSFGKLRQGIEEVQRSVNALLNRKRETEPDEDGGGEEAVDEAAAETTEEVSDSGEQTVTVARVSKRKRAVQGMEPADVEEIGDRLAAISAFLRGQDPGNPASYLMLRGYRWGELRASGSTAPDALLLEPPRTDLRVQVKKLALEGDYEGLLRLCEDIMATPGGRGWLDLQRYTVLALDSLGYSAASAAVKSAVKSLLQDLPDMQHMTLMDDSPVANAETQAWITEHILPPPPEPAVESAPQQEYVPQYEPEPEPVALEEPVMEEETPAEPGTPDVYELALEAVRNGDKQQALELLASQMTVEKSGRARFRRKMQLAQICISIGKAAIARPILEEMAGEIDKRKLEEWEAPDVVAHALSLLYRCTDGDNDKKQKLYGMICRLDPVQAFQVMK